MTDSGTTPPTGIRAQDSAALRVAATKLTSYIAALDHEANEARQWLAANETLAVLGYHWLDRAIESGREKKAVKLLQNMGEAAAFVLSIGAARERGFAVFGADSDFAREAALHTDILPKKYFPGLTPPQLAVIDAAPPTAPVIAPPPPPPAAKKKWWQKQGSQKPAINTPHTDRAHAEWRAARDEIAALQHPRHYYVDGLMDWVGDTLAGGEAGSQPNIEADPARIAALAAADHARDMAGLGNPLRSLAKSYVTIATLLDAQDMPGFLRMLPVLFPAQDDPAAKKLREFFYTDYDADSFAEIALTSVKNRDDQLKLFKAALKLEPGLSFRKKTPREVYQFIKRETQEKKDPLPRKALTLARERFEEMGQAQHSPSELPTLADLFNRAISRIEAALNDAAARNDARNGPRYAPRP